MAPFIGPSRGKVLFLLRWCPFLIRFQLPLTLGMGAPMAFLTREEGLWRVRALTVDTAAVAALAEERARNHAPFVPEMVPRVLGPILAESPSARGLARKLATLEGPLFEFVSA